MKARHQNRVEMLRGTLDMLILQTLQLDPQHGYIISQAVRTNPARRCKLILDRSIRRCAGWRDRSGSARSGRSPRKINGSRPIA
jgi:hypothetical protein